MLTADLNGRMMRTYKASRRKLFERLDKPQLSPLPAEPFEASAQKTVGLNVDYHVAFEDHFYSAPHTLRHEDVELWLRATTGTVEIFHGRERMAAHLRSYVRGGFTTITEPCRAATARTRHGLPRASSAGPIRWARMRAPSAR